MQAMRQIRCLVFIFMVFLNSHILAYRRASFNSDGNANAQWNAQFDSNEYSSRRDGRQIIQEKLNEKRQALERGIQRHRSSNVDTENANKKNSQPPVEVDPIEGFISNLRQNKPISLGFDNGDRQLAADLNILPQSLAPQTPGTSSKPVKIDTSAANSIVLVILPSERSEPSSKLKTIALESATKAECLIFQPDQCEFDLMSKSEQDIKIPNNAVPFSIPRPGKHVFEMPEGFVVDPSRPIMIMQTMEPGETVMAIKEKLSSSKNSFHSNSDIRGARDIVASLYYANNRHVSNVVYTSMRNIPMRSTLYRVHLVYDTVYMYGFTASFIEYVSDQHFALLNSDDMVGGNRRRVEVYKNQFPSAARKFVNSFGSEEEQKEDLSLRASDIFRNTVIPGR